MSFGKPAILLTLILAAVAFADPIPRLIGGQDVNHLSQFPHHVNIVPYNSNRKCGGSILNAQWILTSAACVKDSIRLQVEFKKDKENDPSSDFYSISLNSDQVYVYPTNYDDIALIRIPIQLICSDTISPIKISQLSIDQLRNRFVVMPGFSDNVATPTTVSTPSSTPIPTQNSTITSTTSVSTTTQVITTTTAITPTIPIITTVDTRSPSTPTTSVSSIEETTPSSPITPTTPVDTTTQSPTSPSLIRRKRSGTVTVADNLKYGMFNVLDNSVCKQAYGNSKFDEYTQLCVGSWGNNEDTPCDSDFGSGLIVGWPAMSELIGLFSMFSPSCNRSQPSIFTYAPKYLPWIQSMIQG